MREWLIKWESDFALLKTQIKILVHICNNQKFELKLLLFLCKFIFFLKGFPHKIEFLKNKQSQCHKYVQFELKYSRYKPREDAVQKIGDMLCY